MTFRWGRGMIAAAEKGGDSLVHKDAVMQARGTGGPVAGTGAGGGISLWDSETGCEIMSLAGHPGATALSLSLLGDPSAAYDSGTPSTSAWWPASGSAWEDAPLPDILVSGGTDGYVAVWDLRMGTAIARRRISQGRPGAVTDISAWGYGASCGESRPEMTLFQVAAGARRSAQRSARPHGGDDAKVEDEDADDVDEGADSRVSRASQGAVRHSQASLGSLSILAGLSDGFVVVLDPRKSFVASTTAGYDSVDAVGSVDTLPAYSTRCALKGHKAPVLAVRASPCGRVAISTAADGVMLAHDITPSGAQQLPAGAGAAAGGAGGARAGAGAQAGRALGFVDGSRRGGEGGMGGGRMGAGAGGLRSFADMYEALEGGVGGTPSRDGPSALGRAPSPSPSPAPAPSAAAASAGSAAAARRIPFRSPIWGMGVSQGPRSAEAKEAVGGGDGGRAVTCLEVGPGFIVCGGEDGVPLVLRMTEDDAMVAALARLAPAQPRALGLVDRHRGGGGGLGGGGGVKGEWVT